MANKDKHTLKLSAVYTRTYAEAERAEGEKVSNVAWRETATYTVSNKKTKEDIATVTCHGVNDHKELEISYEILNEDNIAKLMKDAMADLKSIMFGLETEVDYIILKSKEFNELEKSINTAIGFKEEKENFWVCQKTSVIWTATYMCLGMSIGMVFGSSKGNAALGMSIGIGIGIAIGAALDASQNAKAKKIREEHNKRYGIIEDTKTDDKKAEEKTDNNDEE